MAVFSQGIAPQGLQFPAPGGGVFTLALGSTTTSFTYSAAIQAGGGAASALQLAINAGQVAVISN